MADSDGRGDADPQSGLGRWRTLKDAAAILHLPQRDLLRSLKRGTVRGTQIGNNWFAYVDPDMAEAAEAKARAKAEKIEARKKTVKQLRDENRVLKAQVKKYKKTGNVGVESTGSVNAEIEPVLSRLGESQKAVQSELSFLREEIRAIREQHAEEMRRKDVLLQQSHEVLQDVVRSGILKAPESHARQEMDQLRLEHRRSMQVLGEMTNLMGVVLQRLRRTEEAKQ